MAVGAASNFVLNIVELQNVITSAGGDTPVTALSNTVSQLQRMINFDAKQIKVNTISAYDTTPIQVTDSLNLGQGASLTLNGDVVSGGGGGGGGSYGSVSSIGFGPSATNYVSTITAGETAISFQVGGGVVGTPIQITADGTTTIAGPLRVSGAGTPALGRYLTCMDANGRAEWQEPAMVSDGRWKEGIESITDYRTILDSIRGVRFRWSSGGGQDVGVVAQDVMPVLPEAVIEGVDGLPHRVHYHKIIPVLVEAVKGLLQRVEQLECGYECSECAARRP